MTAHPEYHTGTVSVSNGDTVIVGGAGAIWSGINVKPGDTIYVADGAGVEIKDVIDPTHLTLWSPWSQGDKSGATYTIVQDYPSRVVGVAAAEDVGDMLAALKQKGLAIVVVEPGGTPDPSLGEENQYAEDPSNRNFWRKTGGVWVPQTQVPILNIANIDDLRARNVVDGVGVSLLGYLGPGRGGGGTFYGASSSTAADNGGTIIAPDTGPGRWLRISPVPGVVQADWFGVAAGDPSAASANVTAFAAAFAAVPADGGTLLLPPGRVYVNGPWLSLISRRSIEVRGVGPGNGQVDGQGASEVVLTANVGPAIRLDGTQGVTIRNVVITYSNPSYTLVSALIDLRYVSGSGDTTGTTFIDCEIAGWNSSAKNAILIDARNHTELTIIRGYWRNAYYGIVGARSAVHADFCNGVVIDGTKFDQTINVPIIAGGSSWSLLHLTVEPTKGTADGASLDFCMASPYGVDGLNVSACRFYDGGNNTGAWFNFNSATDYGAQGSVTSLDVGGGTVFQCGSSVAVAFDFGGSAAKSGNIEVVTFYRDTNIGFIANASNSTVSVKNNRVNTSGGPGVGKVFVFGIYPVGAAEFDDNDGKGIQRSIPLSVLSGGTSGSSYAVHGILLGQDTGTFHATAAMTDGQLLVGQTNADPLPKTISGDGTMSAAGALTITKTNGVSFASIATSGSASDLSTGTVPLARISGLTTAQFAANVVDTDATLAANSSTRVPAQSAVKSYVDNYLTGLQWKAAVLLKTTGNIALSGEQTIDGTLTSASRVLVASQSTASQNGIYVSAAGAWSRATDMDTGAEFPSATVFVASGTVNHDTQWTCTNDSVVVGSTSVVFAQVSGAGTYSNGTGLSLSGNQFSIDPAWAGQTGITTVGTISTGTWNGTVISPTYGGTGVNNAGRTLTINTNSGTIAFGAASKTLTINKTVTLDGTDGVTMTLPSTSATLARTDAGQTFNGTQVFSSTITGSISGSAATLATARNIDGQAFDGSSNITVVAPGTHAATSKATPVDADELPLVDSAATNVLKKLTWANLKATLKAYFDTLYASISGVPRTLYWEVPNIANAADTNFVSNTAFSVPANTLTTNGDALLLEVEFLFSAAISSKTYGAYVGYSSWSAASGFVGGLALVLNASSNASTMVRTRAMITRTGSGSAQYYSQSTFSAGTAQTIDYTSGSIDWTAAQNILVEAKDGTGNAAAVTIKQVRVTLIPYSH
jgi:hypothetical protein